MKYLVTTLLLVGSMNSFSSPEIKGNPEELRSYFHPKEKTVVIRDEAEETAYTDEATVNLVVKTEDKRLSVSIKLNSDLRSKIEKTLIEKGVNGENIKNSKFSTSPQYGWFGSEPDSYEVMNRMAVKISSEKHLEAIAMIADSYEQVTLSGTMFEHSKKVNFERRVKKKALDKVLEKKKFYEESLGIKLTPVLFTESDVGIHATQGAQVFEEEIIVTGMRAPKNSFSKRGEYASERQSTFDEVKYRAVVTVEFRVN